MNKPPCFFEETTVYVSESKGTIFFCVISAIAPYRECMNIQLQNFIYISY